jgi:DNA-binding GntR family transcriptional regulator
LNLTTGPPRLTGEAGTRPLWIEDRYIVHGLASRLRPRDYATPSLLATLAQAQGFNVNRGRVRITARAASRDEARLLEIRPGAAVLVGEFAVQADGRPAQFVRARFRPDRYAFAFTVESDAPPRARNASREGIRERRR